MGEEADDWGGVGCRGQLGRSAEVAKLCHMQKTAAGANVPTFRALAVEAVAGHDLRHAASNVWVCLSHWNVQFMPWWGDYATASRNAGL